jgi:hypothetical protein
MVTKTVSLSRRLAAFLLAWIAVTLMASFSVTHNELLMLDMDGTSVAVPSLEEQQEYNSMRNTQQQLLLLQVQSPRMLMTRRKLQHVADRSDNNNNNNHNKHQNNKDNNHRHTVNKIDMGLRHRFDKGSLSRKKDLPADFVSPTAGRTTMCAVRTKDGCAIQACPHQHQQDDNTTIPAAWNYGHGLVHRDNDIRGTTMMTSGNAKSGSGCAMSTKYKFIYIHVLKSAGMTIKAFLKRALCGGTTGAEACSHENEREVLEIVNCAAALQDHPDYFVWSFVRNPFSRLYSGYSMADSFRNDDMPEFTFQDFATRSQFGRSRMTKASNAHFLPQTDFLFEKGTACPVFDFLGRLEHLDQDLQTVLALVGSPELNDYVQAHNGTIHHESNTAYGTSKTAAELHGDLRNAYQNDPLVVQAAAKEYARDFTLLGYNPNVIPTTTMDQQQHSSSSSSSSSS